MMKALLSKLHTRLGDFWWYSLMLFCASRAADCLNVFVGLWLVPKYVEPSELGAVMPLTNLASFFAIPIAVFASTFRNELSSLAVKGKFGQMKTLMRSVFVATAIFLGIALIVCKLILPAYLERIRVAEGSLALVILVCSFVTTVAPIYTNALQSLKKFKTNSLINLLGAPVRLVTMLVMIPFRALTGYFVGQTAPGAFAIIASVIGLRKELSVPAEPYWNREVVRRFSRLFLIFGISGIASGLVGLVETTILRQRIPEIESAAYYMATRFSDIASFLVAALVFTIFPFTAELAAKGKDTRPIVLKTSLAVIGTNAVLAAALCVFGKQILAFLPHGTEYANYWWAMPWLVGIATLNGISNLYMTAEVSANRFRYLLWFVPLYFLYPAAQLVVTGYGYFDGIFPESWMSFLSAHNIRSLAAALWWMTALNLLRVIFCAFSMLIKKATPNNVN